MNQTILKKLNQIFLIIILGILTLQTSCKKENETTLNLSTLNGTVWKGLSMWNDFISTLAFQESTFTITNFDPDSSYDGDTSATGVYVYDNPKVTLKASGITIDGVISGNKITIKSFDIYGGLDVARTYTKQ